jgi:hypothetical protein
MFHVRCIHQPIKNRKELENWNTSLFLVIKKKRLSLDIDSDEAGEILGG